MANTPSGPRRPRGANVNKSSAGAKGPSKTSGNARAAAKPKPKPSGKRAKKKPSKKILGGQKWLLLLACFVLGLGLGLGLFWYLGQSETAKTPAIAPKPSAPATVAPSSGHHLYEEPANQALLKVDSSIYSALEKAGVEAAYIKLWIDLSSQGEVSRLEVTLNDQQRLEKVAASLDRALGLIAAKYKWQKQDNFWHLDVYLDKQLTHQVNLRKLTTPPKVVTQKPRVAIIVDDVGIKPEALNQLLGLQLELTFSVLPYAPNAPQIARKISGQGRELWLHLPMEPLGRHDPGPGALYSNMSKAEITKLSQQALERVPGAVGVNNHMGSKFTQNAAALEGVFEVLKSRNLMFIDSVTSPHSLAYRQAREMGLVSGQRNIFLDHEVNEQAIVQQIGKLIRLAKSNGQAIAICHPHAATIAALEQTKPLLSQMVELAPASALLEKP